jgi:hypothetical protein
MRRRKKIVPTRTPRDPAIDADGLTKNHASREQDATGSPAAPGLDLEVDVMPRRFHDTASHIAELRDLVRRLRTDQ